MVFDAVAGDLDKTSHVVQNIMTSGRIIPPWNDKMHNEATYQLNDDYALTVHIDPPNFSGGAQKGLRAGNRLCQHQ